VKSARVQREPMAETADEGNEERDDHDQEEYACEPG
jgi:hypothetical protein